MSAILLREWLVAAATFALFSCSPAAAESWRGRSALYKPDLIREARAEFGLSAPIALLAAQIHQESLWRKNARSPYARGLTQFTPGTERWIKRLYPAALGDGHALNPQWAIRAMVKYDHWLYQRIRAVDACHRWAFTLAAYNGGLGWINRDKKLTKRYRKSSLRWWGHVELYSRRAKWAYKENRGYPRKIIYQHQKLYKSWGGKWVC